ncbi:hypothetical protein COCON_G00000050 [Conger conger]|uniref:Thrombospondin-like N-terminal domain-containing protein n=1 Tax=Conger conger TaxID=82655 RepID=A0A9Q1E0J1_CONCO|nr:hypothetical protein COCON_G00000050 [Conger conger]
MWSSAFPIMLFYHIISLTGGSNTPATGERCPTLQAEDWDLPRLARTNVTGFNLVQRFSLWDTPAVEKIWTPKGSVVLRLGKVSVSTETRQVFPGGVPEEFTLVFTLRVRRRCVQDQVSLLLLTDRHGNAQFSLELKGAGQTLSLLWAQRGGAGLMGDLIGCVFSGGGARSLFDSHWHKIVLSVSEGVVSLFVDCVSIETTPLPPRAPLSSEGHAHLGVHSSDRTPAQLDVQRVMLFCDPSLGELEVCCEIPGSWCPPKSRRDTDSIFNLHQFERGALGDTRLSVIKGEKGDWGLACPGWRLSASCSDGPRGLSGQKGEPGEEPGEGEQRHWGKWALKVKGSKGDKGNRGLPGVTGVTGKDGAPGSFCVVGNKGQKGATGAVGRDGKPGTPGRPGKPGIGIPGPLVSSTLTPKFNNH